jgi:gluconokinase
MIVLVMGVTGSGKTTVGILLAQRLGWDFLDADDFHSAANKAKMHQGIPLDRRRPLAVARRHARETSSNSIPKNATRSSAAPR